ncbi:PLP-dependent aminotransferase family protein [Thalassospira lucentensis]|uniref:aminotransferase-like domain-containing protein n=1 Tax=Thalassospira lucentensis TaxID=168935 RepID=UPI00142E1862|nr:PLP-dependent aminotransferase family protein [Thalassospira lucentensis]NIZ00131.1 PLP-dependent aminotransferase family protein [Thalassospira lucentensis]
MPKAHYLRLANMVAEEIRNGVRQPGTQMPTHRAFAEKHGIALATATRTYRLLESQGLIVGEQGRGVFVRDMAVPLSLGVEQKPADGQIDLVFNMPGAPSDSQVLRTALKALANRGDLDAFLRYQPHGGRQHERKIIASYLSSMLGNVPFERLLLTSGAQHGLAITLFSLLRRGDAVGTEPLTYPGFKTAAELHGISLFSVRRESQPFDADHLEQVCREKKLRALYLMPTVQNPLGSVMPEDERQQIVSIARKYDLLIFEDSAYAFLETNPPISFFELAPERTIYIGGFSKNIATGLRLGYVIAPDQYLERMIYAIRATTWNVPALISAIICGWVQDGTLAEFEKARRADGARRQNLCREVLRETEIVSHPNAGFIWLPLSRGLRAEPIIREIAANGVAVAGSEPYAVTEAAPHALRVAFGGIDIQELHRALEIIRDCIVSQAR